MILAIIQARMGSTRLPGKMLSVIGDRTLIRHCVDQVRQAQLIDRVLVATTVGPEDDPLVEEVVGCGGEIYRGSSTDVLDRFYQAAKAHGADVIVRICGDCPFIDPEVIDRTVRYFLDNSDSYDYVSNVHPPSVPDGYDVEVVTFRALERAWSTARMTSQREHVTTAIWEHPETYRVGVVTHEENLSHLRVVVDEPEDLEMLRALYVRLSGRPLTLANVVQVLREKPEISVMNKRFEREAGYRKSLAEDRYYER